MRMCRSSPFAARGVASVHSWELPVASAAHARHHLQGTDTAMVCTSSAPVAFVPTRGRSSPSRIPARLALVGASDQALANFAGLRTESHSSLVPHLDSDSDCDSDCDSTDLPLTPTKPRPAPTQCVLRLTIREQRWNENGFVLLVPVITNSRHGVGDSAPASESSVVGPQGPSPGVNSDGVAYTCAGLHYIVAVKARQSLREHTPVSRSRAPPLHACSFA